MNTVLARGVGSMLHQPPVTEHRRHIDDGTAAGGNDRRYLIFQSEKYATEVDADGLIPTLHGHLCESLCAAVHTGVIHGHVQIAVGPHRSLHSLFNVTRIRHVTRYYKSISPRLGDRGRGRL